MTARYAGQCGFISSTVRTAFMFVDNRSRGGLFFTIPISEVI